MRHGTNLKTRHRDLRPAGGGISLTQVIFRSKPAESTSEAETRYLHTTYIYIKKRKEERQVWCTESSILGLHRYNRGDRYTFCESVKEGMDGRRRARHNPAKSYNDRRYDIMKGMGHIKIVRM